LTGDACEDGLSQLLAKRAIDFGMSLNGGPHDDLAANVELAVCLFRAGLELRKFGLGFFMPFEQLGDPLMQCFSVLAHACLPLG
jgi:hypothetical protein